MGMKIEDWLLPGFGTANEWAMTAAAMNYNSAEAQKNRDFQERLANTAHQREVADLRKAGLNPILTATGGNGASSPVGGSASIGLPSSNLAASVQANTQRKLGKVQAENTFADTILKQAQKGLVNEQEHNAFQEGMNLFKVGNQLDANTMKIYQDIENSKTLTNAQALNLLYGSEAQKTSAAAAMKSAIASGTNAQAAIINATSGNKEKIIMNELKTMKGFRDAYKWLHK